jgi:hypothetical protein
MKKSAIILVLLIALIISLFAFVNEKTYRSKINGVSFVGPRQEITANELKPISTINANWIAIIPYAFSRAGVPEVSFSYPRQWWGERLDGVGETIRMAKDQNLRIMLKPHIWVRGQGWAGDFDLETEEEWAIWEKSYREYIIAYARLADSLNVELFCIGTEYRKAAVKRPAFWHNLIAQVRQLYKGEMTYAANWDNYENIEFWNDLDYIGIDAYFPISEDKTPTIGDLEQGWQKQKNIIHNFSVYHQKPILFTEFGYQSIDYTSDGHWKYNQDTLSVNAMGQSNAYEAIFKSYWKEEWFAGGFLWKWHSGHDVVGGSVCKRFTPQNKPAEAVIRKYYQGNNLN